MITKGMKFGKWTVLKEAGKNKDRRRLWLCKCECGYTKAVIERYLLKGQSTQCGKCDHEDLTGKKFGKLTVQKLAYKKKRNSSTSIFWQCLCDCGNFFIARSDALKKGTSSHCGCSHRHRAFKNIVVFGEIEESFPHYKKIRMAYIDMIRRCEDEYRKAYKNYGGRGISVCKEWKNSFRKFYNWMIKQGFSIGLTIERIDNNGNYEPENCCLATKKEQCRNTRKTKLTMEKAEQIRRLLKMGVRQCKIAKAFGIADSTVHKIKNGTRW